MTRHEHRGHELTTHEARPLPHGSDLEHTTLSPTLTLRYRGRVPPPPQGGSATRLAEEQASARQDSLILPVSTKGTPAWMPSGVKLD